MSRAPELSCKLPGDT